MRLDKAAVIARIKSDRAIAILRTATTAQARAAAEAVIAGGFRIVEITYGCPNAIDVIAGLVRQNSSELIIGAGTVMTRQQASDAIDAGAQFLVSPSVTSEMIETARERNVVSIPGAFTPTEIWNAHSLGADLVKLFPAVVSGPAYLRAIRGPLPQISIVPTAGVSIVNVAEWFDAGAVAVGAAGGVFDKTAMETGDWDRVRELAREFIAAVHRTP